MLSRMVVDDPEGLESYTCIVPISIDLFYNPHDGKERLQEGGNLAAIVYMLNQLKLASCVIVIADTLQRHNVTIESHGMIGEAAIEKAKEAGKNWKDRNDHIISRLAMPYQILYWDPLYKHEGYESQKAAMQRKYDSSTVFMNLVDQVARHFINGFGRGNAKHHSDEMVALNLSLAVKLSIEYLLEELSVISLWRDGRCKELIGSNEKVCMMYPFGNSSPSTDIYNCINYVCQDGGNLLLRNIKKEQPEKKPKAVKPKAQNNIPGIDKPTQKKMQLIKAQILETLHSLITLSSLSEFPEAEIALYGQLADQVRALQERTLKKNHAVSELEASVVSGAIPVSVENKHDSVVQDKCVGDDSSTLHLTMSGNNFGESVSALPETGLARHNHCLMFPQQPNSGSRKDVSPDSIRNRLSGVEYEASYFTTS